MISTYLNSWLAIHVQHALGNPSPVSSLFFSYIDQLNGWISSQSNFDEQFIR